MLTYVVYACRLAVSTIIVYIFALLYLDIPNDVRFFYTYIHSNAAITGRDSLC